MTLPTAVFFGCAALELSAQEIEFFTKVQPAGFILFSRNCESPEQIKALTQSLKSCVHHQNIPILIDQEGGRVQRLSNPHWRKYPPAERFASMENSADAIRACRLNARLMAHDLAALGINTDCAPVADLRINGAHSIIGDRAFGTCADDIVPLAMAQAQGLMDGGIIPVLKHIPGHGRALVDSHEDLPVVRESLDELMATDFEPFKRLNTLPMAMTAHIIYTAIDDILPATLSKPAIDVIRNQLGFDGLLMTDDLSMKALKGDLGKLCLQAIEAGCDIGLHCNGQMDEMQAIATHAPIMSERSFARMNKAFDVVVHTPNDNIHEVATQWAALLNENKAA